MSNRTVIIGRAMDEQETRIIRPLELVSHAREGAGVSELPAITHELVGSEQLGMGMKILEPGSHIRTAPPRRPRNRRIRRFGATVSPLGSAAAGIGG